MNDEIEDSVGELDEDGLDLDTIYENIEIALKSPTIQNLLTKLGISQEQIKGDLEAENFFDTTEKDTEKSYSKRYIEYKVYKKIIESYKPKLEEDRKSADLSSYDLQDEEAFKEEYTKAEETGDFIGMYKATTKYKLFPYIEGEDIIPIKLEPDKEEAFKGYATKVINVFEKCLNMIDFKDYDIKDSKDEMETALDEIEGEEVHEVSSEDRGSESSVPYMDKTSFDMYQAQRWELNPAATIQAYHEKPENGVANYLDFSAGSNIDTGLQDLIEFKRKGHEVITQFNGIQIDTRECDKPEQIIEMYNQKNDELIQKRVDELFKEAETLDFDDPIASMKWIRDLSKYCSKMSKNPNFDKENMQKIFDRNGISTVGKDAAKDLNFYSPDSKESSKWVLTVAAGQLINTGTINQELSERAGEVLLLSEDTKLNDTTLETDVTKDSKSLKQKREGLMGIVQDELGDKDRLNSLDTVAGTIVSQREQELGKGIVKSDDKQVTNPNEEIDINNPNFEDGR